MAASNGDQILREMSSLSDADPRDLDSQQLARVRDLLDSSLWHFLHVICGFRDLYHPLHGPVCTILQRWGEPGYRRLMIQMPRECQHPDDFASTPRGPVRIGDLEAGDELYALSDDFDPCIQRVLAARPSTASLLEITTKSGCCVRVTHNHPFRTVLGWVPASSLKVGDGVAAPSSVPAPEPSGAYPYLAGVLCGDGSLPRARGRRSTPILTCYDPEIIAELERIGVKVRRRRHRATFSFHVDQWKRLPVDLWHGAWEKGIPEEYEGSPGFLRGLFDSDGTVGSRSIVLVTVSARLATDVKRNLLYFGIPAKIARYRSRGPNSYVARAWHVTISTKLALYRYATQIGFVHERKKARLASLLESSADFDGSSSRVWSIPPTWRLLLTRSPVGNFVGRASGSRSEMRLLKDVGIRVDNAYWTNRAKFLHCADLLGRDDLRALAHDAVRWEEIASIRDIGEQPIIELQVTGNHTYLSEGLLSHNSFKTSTCTIGNTLWRKFRDPDNPLAIFNETDRNPKKWLRAMKDIIGRNPFVHALYGHVIPPRITQGEQPPKGWRWSDTELDFQRGRLGIPEATITGMGWTAASTGGHWPEIIKDDIIGRNHRDSPAEMESARSWLCEDSQHLERPASKGMDLIACTPWDYQDAYYKLLEQKPYVEGAPVDGYRLYRRSALENGESVFPTKWTTEELLAMYRRNAFNFMAQMMVLPRAAREVSFDIAWVRYGSIGTALGEPSFVIEDAAYDPDFNDAEDGDTPPQNIPLAWMDKGLFFDPAPTEGTDRRRELNSRNGLVMEGIDPWGRRYLLDARAETGNILEVCDVALKMLEEWGAYKVYIEDVSFTKVFRPPLQLLASQRNQFVQCIPCPPGKTDKDTRIQARFPDHERGVYYMNRRRTDILLQEFMQYAPGSATASKDCIDALGYDPLLQRPESPQEIVALRHREFQRNIQADGRDPVFGY